MLATAKSCHSILFSAKERTRSKIPKLRSKKKSKINKSVEESKLWRQIKQFIESDQGYKDIVEAAVLGESLWDAEEDAIDNGVYIVVNRLLDQFKSN
jgi:hypothetical protein